MATNTVVWIDHKEARIFRLHADSREDRTVLAPQHHVHRHPKGHLEGTKHPEDARRFFGEVATALQGSDAILIVGPSLAKLELFRYLHEHARTLEQAVIGIESADHPTDGQIVARATRAFAEALVAGEITQ